uniref:Neur_chan_LBD domain-containing protein n=1 Tax=Ascaris lumbricoides TaxID=6252 RepID=A0A0M3HUA6_ASCLU
MAGSMIWWLQMPTVGNAIFPSDLLSMIDELVVTFPAMVSFPLYAVDVKLVVVSELCKRVFISQLTVRWYVPDYERFSGRQATGIPRMRAF